MDLDLNLGGPLFRDRRDAGQQLAALLQPYAGRPDVVVMGLPRGGVPVAQEIATALRVALEVFVVRKLGVPGQEELAMGAIASGGIVVLNQDLIAALGISKESVDAALEREWREVQRREQLYRAGRPPLELQDKVVVLVDDGLATGSTMRVAAIAIQGFDPARRVIAVPVGAPSTCEELRPLVDELVCLATPEPFYAVGIWYADFPQLDDDEVAEILASSPRPPP